MDVPPPHEAPHDAPLPDAQPRTPAVGPVGPDDARLRAVARSAAPVTWVVTGDSITSGARHTAGRRHYVELLHERLRGELGRSRDIVVNTGVSGDLTDDLLGAFDARVARFAPAVVSVMFGTNDAKNGPAGRSGFRDALTAVIDRVRATGALPILHTPPGIDTDRDPTRADLPAYAAVVHDVAAATGTVLVDHWAHWSTQPLPQRRRWLDDAIHPNALGHQEVARTLFRRLGIFDPLAPTCSRTLP